MAALAAGLILRPTLAYAGTLGLESTYLPHGLLLGAALGGLTQAAALALVCRGRALAARPPRTEQSTAAPAPHPRGPRSRSGSWPGLRRLAAGRWPRLLMLTLTLYTLAGVVTFVGADLGPLELSAPETLGLGLATALLALGLQRFGGLVGSLPGSVPTLGGGVAVLALTGYLRLDVGAALLMVALSMTAAPLSVALHRQLLVAQAVGGARLRGQQVIASLLGLAAALVVIAAGHETYFERGFIPPAAVGLAAGLDLTNQPAALMALLPWLLVGALLQWLGGPRQSVGLLFATGLLIALPEAGWALLAGLGLKALAAVLFRGRAETTMAIFGLGCIAGEMLRTALGG
jgi:hypothetical protein